VPTPILATKLYVSPPRANFVPRPRLVERLNEALSSGRKLTLISAPAGFGKTTLVSEWVADCRRPVAWLSLDEGDNDPIRFLTYLVAALQTIAPAIGAGLLGVLQSPQPPSTESILTDLLNEITISVDDFVLVLDDYHVIDCQPVDEALAFLLEHLPPQMHLVITTREDPHLPLARLRARGLLAELRAADLRFSPTEVAEFLNQAMALNLSTKDVTALEARTEGWIAGLQLAALSMQGHQDATSFINSFTGSHHFVLDYLIEEVLGRQSESVQAFLLRTSILDRMCGPLCDAVLFDPTTSGQETLEYLERANLFIVPLDNERRWYRYHQLFGDLLRQRLLQQLHQSTASSPGDERKDVAEYHSRASIWYEDQGLESEAFHHAVEAKDLERAASVAEMAWQAMDSSFQSAAWLGWVKKLPDELIRNRPMLSTQYASALMDAGEPEASESRLQDAERRLDTPRDMNARLEGSSDGMVVVDAEQFRTLPVRIALIRAYNAQAQGDVPGAVKYAELALDLSPEGDQLSRGGAAGILGLAYWARGDLETAHRNMADWVDTVQQAGNIAFAIASAFYLAEIRVAQGRLHEAVRTNKQSLQLASEHDKHVQRLAAHQLLGLAMLYHEMGEQEAATQHLLESRELGEQASLVDWPYRWRLAQARLKEAGGDLEAALDLLDEAKPLYVRGPVPDIHPIEALKARVYIRQGRVAEALDWAREQGLSIDDDLSYLREFEHITLARALMAEYQSDRADRSILEAMSLLERLLRAAEEGRRTGSVIAILVLQSLAHQAQSNIPLALLSLERALALAEPEGYARIFVDEGAPMAQLLSKAAVQGVVPGYIGKLLAVFDAEEQTSEDKPSLPLSQPLIEPLSQRELEVLHLVAQGLSNREISERLFLALSTVKGHNQQLFGKLQVQSRTEAVARARELGLL
jgi:LuxR family maltose regulon positive regulatory protein